MSAPFVYVTFLIRNYNRRNKRGSGILMLAAANDLLFEDLHVTGLCQIHGLYDHHLEFFF